MIRDGIVPKQDAQSRPRFTPTGPGSSLDPLVTALGRLSDAGVRNLPGFANAKSIDIEIPLDDALFLGRGLSRRTGLPIPPD